MAIFNAVGVAGTGVTVYRKWLDAVSDNIANMNNVSRTSENAFQARYVIAQEAQDGNGAQVGGTVLGSAEGKLVYEPSHPLADSDGYVRYPDIDLGSQMGQMIMAQRAYQANLSVVDRARDAYTAAIQLGSK
ncbi:flagellar basal body rod protein FlgC [Spirilliplanes yamanashiensis]|jgi:flagellar basal-body rod protein FlgC|uniref:Flagellar basal-body rod protein FlgC n=1 Tax=Spirilliplanes yamanashiensis TaxID=42233 RepID=A0A8J3Y5A6_9ACTN|nr:flagellar basal body rod C-terminal domain-containing protein [Spirilliplanes yamanashiensis]MDP9814375.1 flagellar basal-body rod protein FlgC [Spirilliplanes yamanashiensis]GIJ02028.1 flagellar basal-body rod protein FlgC [Spirilliplanes yamanashiensis]